MEKQSSREVLEAGFVPIYSVAEAEYSITKGNLKVLDSPNGSEQLIQWAPLGFRGCRQGRELGEVHCSCARDFWWDSHRDEPWESVPVALQCLPWAWVLREVERS